MRWIYLSIPNFNLCTRWSLGMDKLFHRTLYNGCDYISMLGLKLIHFCKRGPSSTFLNTKITRMQVAGVQWPVTVQSSLCLVYTQLIWNGTNPCNAIFIAFKLAQMWLCEFTHFKYQYIIDYDWRKVLIWMSKRYRSMQYLDNKNDSRVADVKNV